ncbi:MAG: Bifunctional glutamine synthetase adenylyltransferase/adenylyl-removing enzyme [Bacteroidetes bacterium]|nr:Bifunctional glutamine synthetase adenylyltransferase/adenylyl-removing enzyme [Bacteroidota bacterium]
MHPKTLVVSPLEKISEIKNRIESKTQTDLNIKLGTGGIRDIEFITQALQLLNSPLHNEVRQQNTLAALGSLAGVNALAKEEHRDLRQAYLFLRSVEHRLQLLHGQQTHSLPETQDEKQSLAKSLGFESSAKFDLVLQQHRKRVRDIFVSVFEPRESGKIHPAGSRREAGFFKKTKLTDRKEAAKNLNEIRREFPALNEGSLQAMFWKSLRKYSAEDCALKNFALLCSQASSRTSLTQAVQNERLFDLIILLCSRSSRLIQTLSGEPLLFETLLADPAQLLDEKPGWSFLLESDPLRFRLFNEFKILLRFFLGHGDLETTTKNLSDLADIVVKKAFALHIHPRRACLVALGKFGGAEMSFGSDLDIIGVYDDAGNAREMDLALKKFFNYFRSGANQIYDIDFRLRPEGKNSPLATELNYYDGYMANRASLWEKQSLLKARVVCGNEEVGKEVQLLIKRHLSSPLQKGWTKEILGMRRRMESERVKRGKGLDLKLSKGGLADIEFLAQVLQLKDATRGIGLSTFSSLGQLAEKKILTRSDARKLLRNYGFLRTMELLIRLNSQSSGAEYPGDKKNRKQLASGLGEKSEKTLMARTKSILMENRSMFLKALSLAAT